MRIIGASTKTPFGIYAKGNTGAAIVWFFKPMPIPEDLKKFLFESDQLLFDAEQTVKNFGEWTECAVFHFLTEQNDRCPFKVS